MSTEAEQKMDSGSPDVEAGMTRGLVLCNVGMGKGKTTAAFGVVVRALGAGMDVFVLQFVKAKPRDDADRKAEGEWPLANELKFLNSVTSNLGKIESEVCGAGFVGILGDEKEKELHVEAAQKGLVRAKEVMRSGKYQLVLLDEIISAVEVGLISEDDVVDVLKAKPEILHLIITGHNKYPKILELCDTVTEMKILKHAYYDGKFAVEGIDY